MTTDLVNALQASRRQPGVTMLAIFTMALGIAAATVLFGLVYGVLLKPLPWPDSDRLVRLSESRRGFEPRVRGTITNATYVSWHAAPEMIEAIAGWRNVVATMVTQGAEPVRLPTASVTPTLFGVLRAQPHRGRVFVDADGRPGGAFPANDVVVLSYGLWQQQFGGRDSAVGESITINDRPHTIVGVMPPDFAFPDRATRAWTPFAVPSVLAEQGGRRVAIFSALARLRPGATPEQASAEGTSRARSAPDPGLAAVAMFGGNGPAEIRARPAIEMMTADVKPALLIMLAAVALLLITSTANVASLQLARATARRRELAIRAAIGAATSRLLRQLIVESLMIGVVGGLVGLWMAVALTRVLPTVLPADFPRVDDIAIDSRMMAVSVALSIVAGLACSLLPLLHARRLSLTETLAENTSTVAGSGRWQTLRARSVIMASQIAVACVLLIVGALLTRSFVALLSADRGYEPRNVLTARLPLPAGFEMKQRTALLDTIVERMRTVPGVLAVAYGNALPLLTSGGFRAFKMRPPSDPSVEMEVNTVQRVVSPGYFQALGLRVAAGRTFTEADTFTSREVIVVNQAFASRYLGTTPLGAIVPNLGMCRGDNDQWEVVGVVHEMRQGSVADPPQPEIFMPYAQVGCAAAVPEPIVVIRTDDDPVAQIATLRAIVRQEAPTLALDSVMTMDERVMRTLAKPRLYAIVIAAFGGFALAIAAAGLFGVLSYSVSLRTREISVRTALGARPSDIVRLVVRQAVMMLVVGITCGVAMASIGSRWLASMLHGVDSRDPLSFLAAPALLAMVTLVACLAPARRAATLDPARLMRG